MISMHWSVRPAILAGASLCVSNRPQKRSKLVVLCAVLVVMLCGAGSIASAQTAYFSGAQTTVGSGFSLPDSVAVDGSGNVYVADAGNNAVKEILAAGGYTTINALGSGFSKPNGVAVDGSGNVYVADAGNNAVKEILAAGGYTTVNTLGSGFASPTGVAVDGNGNVFVADADNNAVKEILAAGGYTTVNTLGSGFSLPFDVAVDGSGNVFVADYGNTAVKEILAAGGYTTVNTLGSGFSYPGGVTVDGSGNVFVADSGSSSVKEIAKAGANFGPVNVGSTGSNFITLLFTFDAAGTLGSTPYNVLTQGAPNLDFNAAATQPSTVCVTGHTYNLGDTCTVNLTFKPTAPGTRYGAAELLGSAGNLLATGYAQGTGVGPQVTFANTTSGVYLPGTQSTLGSGFYPEGVAVDGSGNVFVADYGNGALKEIVAAGGYATIKTLGNGIWNPIAVAVDGSGNLFVADFY